MRISHKYSRSFQEVNCLSSLFAIKDMGKVKRTVEDSMESGEKIETGKKSVMDMRFY